MSATLKVKDEITPKPLMANSSSLTPLGAIMDFLRFWCRIYMYNMCHG